MLTMGSLFDGIGGFPLAAVRNGVVPVWASEIEAFPIEVTKLRFPDMVHVGDITKLSGAELPPVDIVCGGSPCQDLSVAGARAGLAGVRSGLFMEQTRVVKEMRDADRLRGRTAHPCSAQIYGMGKRPRSLLLGRRRGLPGGPRRNHPNCGLQTFNSSTCVRAVGICWGRAGKPMLPCLASTGRSILGRRPKTPSNLPCRGFYRRQCPVNTI